MRVVKEAQKKFGEVDISKIEIDLKSRDEIPRILLGLQHIYCTPELREKIFKILEEILPSRIDTKNGRPGMELWKILVLGTVRLACDWDFYKLQDFANNHQILRQMLGHGMMDVESKYAFQTIIDNVSMFTDQTLNRISKVVIEAGHNFIGRKKKTAKNEEEKEEEIKLTGRCDSFVVKTDVHYLTDINLLFDAMRKVITLLKDLCFNNGLSDWRKGLQNIKKIKKAFR